MVGIGVELALIFGLRQNGDLGSGGIGIGFVAGETVNGGMLGFECSEHVIEGAVLHHENDDMFELLDPGFGPVWRHCLAPADFCEGKYAG